MFVIVLRRPAIVLCQRFRLVYLVLNCGAVLPLVEIAIVSNQTSLVGRMFFGPDGYTIMYCALVNALEC